MFLLFSFLLLFQPAIAEDSVVEWLVPTEHDFGDLKQGESVTFDFTFRNISDEAIVIDNVRSSCGCTATDWTDEVIPPGDENAIQIEFSTQKEGFFYKKITVFFSGQRKGEKLFITGYVE